MFTGPRLANVHILKNLVGSRTNLKDLIHLILIKICETISVLFMNIKFKVQNYGIVYQRILETAHQSIGLNAN